MSNWRKELRALSRQDPQELEFEQVIMMALHKDESDRGCALIAGSIAENALEEIIRARLVPLGNTRLEELFGYDGVFGSFSAKIKTAYAFGLIDQKLRDDFDRLREIRNVFAHARTVVRFKTPQIAKACSGFLIGYPDTPPEGKIKYPRIVYIDTAISLVSAANIILQRVLAGHTRKLKQTLSYDDIAASREKFRQRLLRRIRPNPRERSKRKAR